MKKHITYTGQWIGWDQKAGTFSVLSDCLVLFLFFIYAMFQKCKMLCDWSVCVCMWMRVYACTLCAF